MFLTALRKTALITSSKRLITSIPSRSYISVPVKQMRLDNSSLSDLDALKSEVAVLSIDNANLKQELASVKSDLVAANALLSNVKTEIYKSYLEQNISEARHANTLLLLGMFSVGTATVALSQFLTSQKDEMRVQSVPKMR